MFETIKLWLTEVETIFENYQFTKDFIVASLGVVLGGMVTVVINRGAIRKQTYFGLQYKILNQLVDQVFDLEKSIEHLEIGLSFGNRRTAHLENEINAVEHKALILNEVFREKRNLVHKYLTGVMLEESAHITSKLYNVVYDKEQLSLTNPVRKEIVSIDDITTLREITAYTRKLKNEIIDSLENLIFPSALFKLKRNFKKAKVFCGNCYGIWKVQCTEQKKAKKKVNKWQN